MTALDTRIGYPTEHLAAGSDEEILHPMYATGIGLIIKGYEDALENEMEVATLVGGESQIQSKRWWTRMLVKAQDWFVEGQEDFK